MKFIIATNNPKKLGEIERILTPLGIEAVSAKEAGIKLENVEENGTTFAENAYLKAYSAFKATTMAAIADDSGLSVDALNGAPGIYSARYAGENASDVDRIQKLLFELKNVRACDRTARFTCSICCIMPNGDIIRAEGVCEGSIAFAPKGKDNFGYDPVFLYKGKTFAEMNSEEKDAVSHRGIALRKLRLELIKYLEDNDA